MDEKQIDEVLEGIASVSEFSEDLAAHTTMYYTILMRGGIMPQTLAEQLTRDWHAMQLEALAPYYRMFR